MVCVVEGTEEKKSEKESNKKVLTEERKEAKYKEAEKR
jgi:hypothetical protein